jgi:hypothetical protein
MDDLIPVISVTFTTWLGFGAGYFLANVNPKYKVQSIVIFFICTLIPICNKVF